MLRLMVALQSRILAQGEEDFVSNNDPDALGLEILGIQIQDWIRGIVAVLAVITIARSLWGLWSDDEDRVRRSGIRIIVAVVVFFVATFLWDNVFGFLFDIGEGIDTST